MRILKAPGHQVCCAGGGGDHGGGVVSQVSVPWGGARPWGGAQPWGVPFSHGGGAQPWGGCSARKIGTTHVCCDLGGVVSQVRLPWGGARHWGGAQPWGVPFSHGGGAQPWGGCSAR